MDKLTPLTPAQQAGFEVHRESAAVVQNRCKCGAWYETPRQSHEFQEQFFCDCGLFLSFKVPAIEAIKSLADDVIRMDENGFGVFDTGMKVNDAMAQASHWWAKTGRRLAQTELKRQQQPLGTDKGNGGAFASLDPDDLNFLPSGLIHGQPWDVLTKREKMMLIKAWHHMFIRKPQAI